MSYDQCVAASANLDATFKEQRAAFSERAAIDAQLLININTSLNNSKKGALISPERVLELKKQYDVVKSRIENAVKHFVAHYHTPYDLEKKRLGEECKAHRGTRARLMRFVRRHRKAQYPPRSASSRRG
jgi:hypothetical protein